MHEWGDQWFQEHGDNLYKAISYIEKNLRKHHIGICGKEKYGAYRDDFLRFWDGGLYEILFGYRAYIGTFHEYKFDWMTRLANRIHHYIYHNIDAGHDKRYFEMLQRYYDLYRLKHSYIEIIDSDGAILSEKQDAEEKLKGVELQIADLANDIEHYSDTKIWKGLKYYMEKLGITQAVQHHQRHIYNKVFQKACKMYPDIIDELVCEIDGYEMIVPGGWGSVDGKKIHDKYWKKVDMDSD